MIVIITSGQPSLNPRLVKEADALVDAGYEVTVIYQYWNDWGTALDKKLLAGKKWKAHLVGGSPITGKIQYLKSRLSFKIARFLLKKFGFKNALLEQAIGRCTPMLINKAKAIKADLYIAHNLAALPAAVLAAKKNKAKCGFDAEDFHRNEVSDNPSDLDVALKTRIEDKYLPQLDYLTTASPLISDAYKKLYPNKAPLTLLNVFPKQHLVKQKANDSPALKLFWFSQTIGINRGLENVIKAIGKKNVELHLLGNHDDSIRAYFTALASQSGLSQDHIHFYKPIPADEIFAFATRFDIGLATELSTPKNRDICLTNKIFTYVQSGLAVLASATTAQSAFLQQFPAMGVVYGQNDIQSLSLAIDNYANDRNLLANHQANASAYALNTLNWDYEKNKLLTLVHATLT
ncbi:hypothetical protein VRU48_08520 [Pedobacter sp. KR3-3]|uniref:Glycosyltransferase subfamily 4-like N-terminal domain-containing protein n=1 Tax=Pedobacter albus TaxID=3113905 RepID=A0ABU7I6P7_9SPHI|nr:hypothetical protein [Pedobacter sp. KR3-3]MEE1945149.1 hypothetical protein [Pedobacter sp. KR3-3]